MKILALDIGGSFIKTGCMDNFVLTTGKTIPTEPEKGTAALIEKILNIAANYPDICAVGISFASQVDPILGVISSATDTFPNFSGLQLKKILEDELHMPVAVDNDVNCAAIAEGLGGVMRGQDNFLCFTFGTGIGGTIMLGGKPLYGAAFAAGEVGHMTTHGGGLHCNCGKNGCYEMYASTTALAKKVLAATGQNLSGHEICALLEGGDAVILPLVDSWLLEVCHGLSSCIHMLNPQNIVLGGGIMENRLIFEMLLEKLRGQLLPNFCKVNICQAELGNNAGIIGGGIIAMNAIHNIS